MFLNRFVSLLEHQVYIPYYLVFRVFCVVALGFKKKSLFMVDSITGALCMINFILSVTKHWLERVKTVLACAF